VIELNLNEAAQWLAFGLVWFCLCAVVTAIRQLAKKVDGNGL
jgi:hypothetical protein